MSKNKEQKIGLIKLLIFAFNKYYPKGRLKTIFLLSSVFQFLSDTLPILFGYLNAKIIDNVIQIISNKGEFSDAIPMIIYFALILLLQNLIANANEITDRITSLWWPYVSDNAYLPFYTDLEPQALEDNNFISLKNTADWNTWSTYDTVTRVFRLFSQFLASGIALIALSQESILFAVIAILASIPGGLVTNKFGKNVWNIWNSSSEEKVRYSIYHDSLWNLTFESALEMKIFGYGKYLVEKAANINAVFSQKLEKNARLKQVLLTFSSLWKDAFLVVIAIYSIKSAVAGNITVGTLTFILAAYQQFNWKVSSVIYNTSTILSNKRLLENFYKLLTNKNKIQSGDTIFPENPNGVSIEFKNVSFKYPKTDKLIFKNLSFQINTDEDLAIVGQNGAGKTTLIKLLLRIYDINEGEILVNGVNIKDLDLDSYYDSVAVLTQSFNQLGVPAEDNIHIGNIKNTDKKKIRDAAKLADTHETIKALPKGYKTYLTKSVNDGTQLSGGQWQKVAIARAFYRDAKLLILDEPTSAVDSISEEKIFDNIRKNATNKTTLIISHRFSTVKKANKIIVIDNGNIVEEGNHESLMKNKGLYSEMYLKQSV